MARHEFKAFVHGSEYLVEDHGNYITIRGDGGGKILDVHRDTAAELVAILEYMGMTLKNNDLSIEEAERMELNESEICDVMAKTVVDFIDDEFTGWTEDEKATMKRLLMAFCDALRLNLVDTECKKLDKMVIE